MSCGAVQRQRTTVAGGRTSLACRLGVLCTGTLIGARPSVVAIACGNGDRLVEVLRRRSGAHATGLDFSAKTVGCSRTALPVGHLEHFTIEQRLSYAGALFALVVCTHVLKYLEYPRPVATELVRICKPGGSGAVVVSDGDLDQFVRHLFWNARGLAERVSDWLPGVTCTPPTSEFTASEAV
jgi:2-polyprenyl-3-methyl-5-hydroxy-6-metoxy-1,4-benzoquinol methylase